MIHMELGPSTIVGVGLALIGLILYFVKTKKPDVSRDYDLFFSSVGLLCGGILIFQGWRLDPILLLCQILSSATAIFFIGESLWLRGTQSKKNIYIVPQGAQLQTERKKNHKSPYEIQKTDETFSYRFLDPTYSRSRYFNQDPKEPEQSMEKKVFSSEYQHKNQSAKHKNLKVFYKRKENAFLNDLTKLSDRYSAMQKEIGYQEKKLSNYSLKTNISYLPLERSSASVTQFKDRNFEPLRSKRRKSFAPLGEFDYTEPIDY